TIAGVLRRAAAAGVQVVAVAGAVETDPARLYAAGLAAVVGLPPRPMSLPEALAEVLPLLEESGESIARLARLGQSL
ncbi:MAG: glycerate kinase, partial [Armatimonadetes bacterium]|nr:glycerate kinase [Armatimonadota bacterium]